MVTPRTRITLVAATAVSALTLVLAPASAATAAAPVTGTTTGCSTAVATMEVTFGVADDATRYGTLRTAQATGEGEFSDAPAMTVRLRDGGGKVVVSKRSSDGGLNLEFWRRIAGPNWTVEATIENIADRPCTTPRIKVATI